MKTKTAEKQNPQRIALIGGVAMLLIAAALLAGCGKKGDPEPPDPNSTYPETYPAE